MLVNRNYLKHFFKIFLSVSFLLALNLAYANGVVGTEDKKSDKKSTKDQEPSGSKGMTLRLSGEVEEDSKVENKNEKIIVADSVDEDSVSKYNFIFYFLYKFKFDQKEATF